MHTKRNPTLGDFAQIVEKDLTNLKVTCEEVMKLSKTKLKEIIKKISRCAAFEEFQTTLLTHKKVKHIKYKQLEIQSYLKSNVMSNEEIKKNAYGRQSISRPMQIVALIPKKSGNNLLILVIFPPDHCCLTS